MKKQRGLKVFLSAALAGSQLLTALSVTAEDGSSSSAPAKSAAAAPQTTVQSELQKLVHEDQTHRGDRPVPAIRQVQATQTAEQASPQQDLKTARKAVREERRQNGFFRRLFTDNSQPKQIPGLGAPPPKIPNPPALIYRSVAGLTVQTGGPAGRTMVVSNSAEPGKSRVPIVTSNAKPVNGNAKVSTGDDRSFENPFETAEGQVDDALMDLDALVAEEKAALEKAESQVESQVESSADPVVREPAVAAEIQPGFSAESTQDDRALQELPIVAESESGDAAPVALPVVEADDAAAEAVVLSEATPAEEDALEAVPLLKVDASDPVATAESMPLAPVEAVVTADAGTDDSQTPAVAGETVKSQQTDAEPQVSQEDEADIARQNPEQSRLSVEERRRLLASRARRDHQTYRIMARTGKTGFKGFCPVELRDNRELVDSRQEHKSRFGLQTYYFSSEEARAAFEENPSRYAPAAGGSDVVLLVNTSEEEPGSLDFSLWYRDRLFLFRSRETQQLFSKNPARYANQY